VDESQLSADGREVPRHAPANLFEVHVLPVHHDLAHQAAVSVGLARFHAHLPHVRHAAQALLGPIAEVLALLRRVNPGEPILCCWRWASSDSGGVTVSDADHQPGEAQS